MIFYDIIRKKKQIIGVLPVDSGRMACVILLYPALKIKLVLKIKGKSII